MPLILVQSSARPVLLDLIIVLYDLNQARYVRNNHPIHHSK